MKRKTEKIQAGWSLCLLLFVFACRLVMRALAAWWIRRTTLLSAAPGSIKAATETGVCIFCHTPHGAEPKTPLWNHHNSNAKYIPYSSSTMIAKVGQPNGASILCLGCHDGTVALGMVSSRTKAIRCKAA